MTIRTPLALSLAISAAPPSGAKGAPQDANITGLTDLFFSIRNAMTGKQ